MKSHRAPQTFHTITNAQPSPSELGNKAYSWRHSMLESWNTSKSSCTHLEVSLLPAILHGAGRCYACSKKRQVIISLNQRWILEDKILPSRHEHWCNSSTNVMTATKLSVVRSKVDSTSWNTSGSNIRAKTLCRQTDQSHRGEPTATTSVKQG